ncbi:MAG: hypothetical protein LBG96_10215 [Tannerella sp.]|nr:hypothetical protein [Tannerella sp.]
MKELNAYSTLIEELRNNPAYSDKDFSTLKLTVLDSYEATIKEVDKAIKHLQHYVAAKKNTIETLQGEQLINRVRLANKKNMNNIIVAEEEKFRAIIHEEVSNLSHAKQEPKTEIDTITLTGALTLLAEYGYILSKAKLYKLTASGNIPCRKFGQKVVFSRKDILHGQKDKPSPNAIFRKCH